MIPSSIKRALSSLRRRERMLTFVWGAARWLAIVMLLLLVCGFVDWLIDRERDTPFFIRVMMLCMQLVVAAVAARFLVFWPQLRWLSDPKLALWVEAKKPKFKHRLISAVQFNQPRADLEGMSKELVGVVTQEADEMTRGASNFAGVA